MRRLYGLTILIGALLWASPAYSQSTFPGRLPVGCALGQFAVYNTANSLWECGNGGVGTGDVVAVGPLTANAIIIGGGGTNVSATTTGAGMLTFLGTPSSSNLAATVTGETGTGALVFATSPAFTTPNLGTPSAGVLTNATGLPISTGVTGLGTGAATALAVNSGSSGAFARLSGSPTNGDCVEFNASGDLVAAGAACGAGGGGDVTASGTLTSNSLIIGGGTTVVAATTTGTGVLTFLGTPSSANLASAVTGETGSGALVFGTSPTLTTPALGTPSALVLTNATGLPLTGLAAQAADTVVANVTGGAAAPTAVTYATLATEMGIPAFSVPGSDCVIEYDVSGGVFECVENATLLAALNAMTGALDWGALTSFEIPNAAAPTPAVFGQIAGDNNAWAASRGALSIYDGTAITFAVATLASDTPSNGQVPKWNTGGTITWENDSAGSALGANLTSSTNDITTDNTAIVFAGASEDLVLTFSANTAALTSTTGVTTLGLSTFALTFGDNVRQTFNPGANAAGLNVGSVDTDPDTPVDGDIFYDGDSDLLRARINGAWVNLGAGGGSGCTTAGSATQVLTDDGAGGCTSNAALTYAAGVVTIGTAGSVAGSLIFNNATSGTVTLTTPAGALGTRSLALPLVNSDTLVALTATQTLTNKTITTPVFNGSPNFGGTSSGVQVSGTDGILTFLGTGNGFDEAVALDLDNYANQKVQWTTSTGVTEMKFGFIIQATGYLAADGSAGGTGSACTAFEEGLCTAASEPSVFIASLGLAKQSDVDSLKAEVAELKALIASMLRGGTR